MTSQFGLVSMHYRKITFYRVASYKSCSFFRVLGLFEYKPCTQAKTPGKNNALGLCYHISRVSRKGSRLIVFTRYIWRKHSVYSVSPGKGTCHVSTTAVFDGAVTAWTISRVLDKYTRLRHTISRVLDKNTRFTHSIRRVLGKWTRLTHYMPCVLQKHSVYFL